VSEVRRGRFRADGTIEEQQRMVAKGVFRVHSAKPMPRLPIGQDIPNEFNVKASEVYCINCGRPATRWDEPCGEVMAMIVRPAD
jgi:hypothetical protein